MASRLSDLQTPCLVLDRALMQRNIERMAERARTLGVRLRPHLKTCKSVEIAAQIAPGRSGVTVSTLQEAEYFAAAGFSDIMYAVSIVPSKLERVAALNRGGADVQLILDCPATARALAERATALDTRFDAWIEIDVDGHRAGLEPSDPAVIETGRLLQSSPNTALRGVMTHAGEYKRDMPSLRLFPSGICRCHIRSMWPTRRPLPICTT